LLNTVWIIKRPADFPEADMLEESDILILIQDAVLRVPYFDNWLAVEEDVKARNIKLPKDKLVSYEDVIDIIEKAEKVIVW